MSCKLGSMRSQYVWLGKFFQIKLFFNLSLESQKNFQNNVVKLMILFYWLSNAKYHF